MVISSICADRPPMGKISNLNDEMLSEWVEFYQICEDGPAAYAMKIELYKEQYRRGNGAGAFALANTYRVGPKPDREKSLFYAREALRLGNAKGNDIIYLWNTFPDPKH
jgi:TPR repeat protein